MIRLQILVLHESIPLNHDKTSSVSYMELYYSVRIRLKLLQSMEVYHSVVKIPQILQLHGSIPLSHDTNSNLTATWKYTTQS